MTDFTALAARARGLTTHLAGAEAVRAAIDDGPGAAAVLASVCPGLRGTPIHAGHAAVELELAIAATMSHVFHTLSRWDGAGPVLEVFFAEEDRRSLRALFKGAVQSAPASERLEGLVPTSTLPRRLLETLAHQPAARDIAAHLAATGHPQAPALLALTARRAHPEPFQLDHALFKGSAARALAALGDADGPLRDLVHLRIDVMNLVTALIARSALAGSVPVDPFIAGGRTVSAELARQLAWSSDRQAVSATLRRALQGTALATVLPPGAALEPALVERRGASAVVADQRRQARAHPLSSAPASAYLLSLSAVTRDLRLVAWGAALGAPRQVIERELEASWS